MPTAESRRRITNPNAAIADKTRPLTFGWPSSHRCNPSRDDPSHGPRTSGQHDRTVGPIADESSAQPHSEFFALTFGQRSNVDTGGALLFQEWRPVVIERSEPHLNRERLFRHILQPMFTPERGELTLPAQRHVALVSSLDRRIERNRFVPKDAEHLHVLSVIPHGCRNCAAGPRHTNHLVQCFRAVRNEIEHQERECPVEASIAEPQLLRIAALEANTVA